MASDTGTIRLGKTFAFSWEILVKNLGPLFLLVVIPQLPGVIFSLVFFSYFMHMVKAGVDPSMINMPFSHAVGGVISIVWTLYALVVGSVSGLAIPMVVQQSVLDKEISLLDAVKAAFPRILPFIGTILLCMVILLGWTLLLFIPVLIFGLYYAFVIEAVALRDVRFMQAVRYSKNLVKGHWWRLSWLFFVLFMLAIVAMMVPSVVVGLVVGPGLIATGVHFILMIFVTAYLSVVRVVLFLALECLKGQGIVSACQPQSEQADVTTEPAATVPPVPDTSEA